MLNMMFGIEVWLYALGIYLVRTTMMIAPNPWKTLWMKYNMDACLQSLYELEEDRAYEFKASSAA